MAGMVLHEPPPPRPRGRCPSPRGRRGFGRVRDLRGARLLEVAARSAIVWIDADSALIESALEGATPVLASIKSGLEQVNSGLEWINSALELANCASASINSVVELINSVLASINSALELANSVPELVNCASELANCGVASINSALSSSDQHATSAPPSLAPPGPIVAHASSRKFLFETTPIVVGGVVQPIYKLWHLIQL